MATATVTGRIADFRDRPIPSTQVKVQALPVQTGVSGAGLHADRPVAVTVAADGTWSVELVPSTETHVRYVFKATWADGGLASTHYWNRSQAIWVPDGGGDILKLAAARNGAGPLFVYVDESVPDPDRVEQYQYNPTTGVLYVRSN